ncbi:hypothetical protein SDC9_191301 [bioreactor metagenome]|uniref:Uncharacterized protein n=1 Tax=bioreactor metagenome TaxID=1076179 RepID=A0A645HXI3_9ZZZZ
MEEDHSGRAAPWRAPLLLVSPWEDSVLKVFSRQLKECVFYVPARNHHSRPHPCKIPHPSAHRHRHAQHRRPCPDDAGLLGPLYPLVCQDGRVRASRSAGRLQSRPVVRRGSLLH